MYQNQVRLLVFFISGLFLVLFSYNASAKAETRCGWVEGYEGYDQWLTDADGEWTIYNDASYKPKHVAEGLDKILLPRDAEVVKVAPYDYYCACLKVKSDPPTMRIMHVSSFRALPVSKCMNDSNLDVQYDNTSRDIQDEVCKSDYKIASTICNDINPASKFLVAECMAPIKFDAKRCCKMGSKSCSNFIKM